MLGGAAAMDGFACNRLTDGTQGCQGTRDTYRRVEQREPPGLGPAAKS